MRIPNFTPGPWRWDYEGPEHGVSNQVLVALPATSGDYFILSHQADWDINPADASLIAAAPEMYEGGVKLNALIVEAQRFLARYIVPDSGISDTDAVNELLGIFDGPKQREAQAKWDAALAKAVTQ